MSASNPAPSRRVLILARTLLVLVSWGGAEGMLYLMGYPGWWQMNPQTPGVDGALYDCDPALGWRARPGQFQLAGFGRENLRNTTLAAGNRVTSESAARTGPRLMFFGDSFVQGFGLSDDETLPWIVQQRHPEAEVLNFGAGNYGTYQSYLALRQQVTAPARVYYLFNRFHEERNAADPNWLRVLNPLPAGCSFPYAVLQDGKLEDRRSRGDLVWRISRHSRVIAMANEYVQIFESFFRVRNKRALTMELLARMDAHVRSQGGEFHLILFDIDKEDRAEYTAFLREKNIAFVDADRPERRDPKLRLPDGHPAMALNTRLAEWLEKSDQ